MIKIGITGGIGSGKTTVAELLTLMGVAVYNCDKEGKRLMHQETEVIEQIKQLFGESVYHKGMLDSTLVSQIVFQNQEMLNRLNAIVHPAVIHDFQRWAMNKKEEVVGIESAILFESAMSHHLDFTIGVIAPIGTRIDRVCRRSNLSREEVLARIGKQMNDETLKSQCDFVVENNDRLSIIRQINTILKQIGTTRTLE